MWLILPVRTQSCVRDRKQQISVWSNKCPNRNQERGLWPHRGLLGSLEGVQDVADPWAESDEEQESPWRKGGGKGNCRDKAKAFREDEVCGQSTNYRYPWTKLTESIKVKRIIISSRSKHQKTCRISIPDVKLAAYLHFKSANKPFLELTDFILGLMPG